MCSCIEDTAQTFIKCNISMLLDETKYEYEKK